MIYVSDVVTGVVTGVVTDEMCAPGGIPFWVVRSMGARQVFMATAAPDREIPRATVANWPWPSSPRSRYLPHTCPPSLGQPRYERRPRRGYIIVPPMVANGLGARSGKVQ